MLVTVSLVSKTDKPSLDKLLDGIISSKEWQFVKMHEIENIVLSESK